MYVGSDGFLGLEFSCLRCCIDFSNQRFPFSQNENNKNTEQRGRRKKNRENPQMENVWKIVRYSSSHSFTLFLKSMDSDQIF